MIKCYTVPEIRHMVDLIFIFHFRLFFRHVTPPNDSKNLTFLKMKKQTPGDSIILHMCTKNYDQNDVRFLRYGV